MTNISDLHIQQEILPFFDFTFNDFSKDVLSGLLTKPLSSTEEILIRQDILKAFIENFPHFENYSYARVDFLEVYNFLKNFTATSFDLKIALSQNVKHKTKSQCIQFVLLFQRLHTNYLQKIDTKLFPSIYQEELKKMNDFLSGFNLGKYEELIREERFKRKHLEELTKTISLKVDNGEITKFWNQFFLFEAYLSISTGVLKYGFSFPIFSDTIFSFEELYHPLLAGVAIVATRTGASPGPANVVKNTFTFQNNVILLTGPNMSGKSTFLKAVGLSVYLGHLGLGVPASKAFMPYFDSITAFINLTDDITNGYSHFMSEVVNVKNVVTEAVKGKKCFSVFDELFRGTNIEDAVEISRKTIQGLTQFKKSFFIISTHLHQLKEIEEVSSGSASTYYFDCKLENNVPLFSYRLKQGWSDLKLGQILFEREGLDELLNPTNF